MGVGWSVVNAIHTGDGTIVTAPATLPEARKVKRYNIFELEIIRVWTATEDVLALQHIWRKLQDTKNTETHQYSVTKAMTQWATMLVLDIYQGVYLVKSTMEDIVGVKMSPTSHVAQFKTVEKGLSLLLCFNCSLADTNKSRRHYDVIYLLATNRNLEEVLVFLATDPRPPPKSFHEMKLCISTYTAMTWALFGDHCHF